MSAKVHSFDIWETCLIRSFARPEHLFFAVAQRYLGERGEPVTQDQLAELQRERREAETAARDAQHAREGSWEVTLEEIYAMLRERAPWIDAGAFQACELALEEASIFPIASTRAEIQRLRAAGERVIFISDMYLPAGTLLGFLRKFGMAEAHTPLYVSGALRRNKAEGTLFRQVCEAEGIELHELAHTGNHPHSDVASPRRLGITATAFTGDRLSVPEQCVLREGQGRPLLASRLAGLMRANRLSCPLPDGLDPALAGFLSGVVAPFLTLYALWVRRRAEALGLERLYFLARDGEVIQRVFSQLWPGGPEARYLYSSRASWGFPSLGAEGPWHWLRAHAQRPASLLRALRLPEETRKRLLARPEVAHFDPARRYRADELEPLWSLLGEPEIHERIVAQASCEREVLMAYLRQEGLFDEDTRWALVDIGWTLSTQAALRRVLAGSGAKERVFGLYFLITERRPPLRETGPFDAMLMEGLTTTQSGTGPGLVQLIAHHAPLIEEVFLKAPEPTTTGFREQDGGVEPVRAEDTTSDWERAYCACLRDVACAFAREAAALIETEADFETLRHAVLANLRRFLESPEPGEAACAAHFFHASEAGQAQGEAEALLRPFTARDAVGVARARLRLGGGPPAPLWRGGSRALSSPLALRALDLASLPLTRLRPGNWRNAVHT